MNSTDATPVAPTYNTMTVDLVRVDDAFHFAATGASSVTLDIDGSVDIGGHNAGARPMEMLLMGLAGCSAIDVIVILNKQKQVIDDFNIQVRGEREAGAMPSPFKTIHIEYRLKGELDEAKVRRAIDLSMDKYCSATAQLRPSADITWSLVLN
ncbi:OsmC family protein [Fibrella aquatica]|uniref:OsmC family protein n=1 Tax=Fibrella aquatica TaxID=3242487 RepID=UPI00352155D5